jgi:hypothetical protein
MSGARRGECAWGWMGSGGPRGLQNRSGPTTSGWVGSIPTRSRHPALLLAALLVSLAAPARAQEVAESRAGVTAAPPLTPRRAFLYSLLLPGSGQAKLDRQGSGAMFFLVEVAALTMVHRSAEDLRIARSFAGDSMPLRYQVDAISGLVARDVNGDPIVTAWSQPRYDDAWVRTRRQHYEDWLAVVIFNHLFSGADAFVAAQLWDLPGRVRLEHSPQGMTLRATIRFR